MKCFKILIVLFFLFSSILLAQNNTNYLISVTLNDNNKLNQIEEIKLPVLHISESELIALVDSEKLISLRNNGINYHI